ncbi:hypothetical protein [Streptomyces roseifaciens]|uniref:hypothetical protein n=1 Tax=Streptomyces roseifaciens TaxID=1488406 RepID=UPI000717E3A7|nr:hypothetical protein [Streptomyces roseifaciens]
MMPGHVRAVVRPGRRHRGATVLLDGVSWTVRPGPAGPPAADDGGVRRLPARDVHWSVDPDGRAAPGWAGSADVLRCGRPSPGPGAASFRAMGLLARHTGCLLTAVPVAGGGLVIGVRGGRLLTMECEPAPHGPHTGAGADEVAVLASYVHGRIVAGLPLERLAGLAVGCAGRVLELREVYPAGRP